MYNTCLLFTDTVLNASQASKTLKVHKNTNSMHRSDFIHNASMQLVS